MCALSVQAQAPYLVSDINTSYTPTAQSSFPRSYTASGSSVYFAATTLAAGTELFKTDGASVEMVKDIVAGTISSSPSSFLDLGNGSFVFSAAGSNGRELWISDGTDAGTTIVKDIFAGTGSSNPSPFVTINGNAYFLATTSNGRELWITGGQEANTQKLGGPLASGVFRFAVLNDVLYFTAGDALWRSDGTPAGTTTVKTNIYPRAVVAAGNQLFIAAWDTVHGYELWRSDGTEGGTTLVKDMNPGAGGAFYTGADIPFGVIGTSAIFFATDGEHGLSLWRSDGTQDGTTLYQELALPTTSVPPALQSAAGVLFFSMNDALWRTDGTAAGTFALLNVIHPYAFAPTGSTLYFIARSSTVGYRIWKSDGSDAGTSMIAPDAVVWENDPQLRYANGKLYFAGYTGTTGAEPWVSDGTAPGTVMLANLVLDPAASANPLDLRAANNLLFFMATDGLLPLQLWRTDGTPAGTLRLTNFSTQSNTVSPGSTSWNGLSFFRRGNELWRSDGTVAGTSLLKTLYLDWMMPARDYLYFSGYAPANCCIRLWRTDGTVAGTISIGTTSYPTPIGDIAGRFYFLSNGYLWETQGLDANTRRITALNDSYATTPVIMGGSIYYSAAAAYPNYELWKIDGTAEGAELVKDIRPGSAASNPHQLTPAGSLLYFLADDGTHGDELWRTDGTEAGTFLLKDISPGAASSAPTSLTAIQGVLYFVANDGVNGAEVWRSDGTPAGTFMVVDLAPGAASPDAQSLAGADGKLYFSANAGGTGTELWTSDGTPAGTTLVADLESGPGSSSPFAMTAAGRALYFNAFTTATGRELWALPLASSAFSIADARVVEGDSGSPMLHFVVTRSGDLSQAATVAYATSNGTATAGTDYTAQSSTLNFASNVATMAIDVAVTPDDAIERNETLIVTLSAPTVGALERNIASGVIEDDDRTSALSVGFVPTAGSYRRIVITNAGPSSATNVQFVFTESPIIGFFSGPYDLGCVVTNGQMTCTVGTLLPGESRTIEFSRYLSSGMLYDTANPPGFTSTASVSAAEYDPDLTNNTASRMISLNGVLTTPAFLIANTSPTLEYSLYYTSFSSQQVTLSSSNPLVVPSPPSQVIPAEQTGTTFTLQVGNGTGTTKLSADSQTAMVIPIVQQGQTPKLDPVFVDMGIDHYAIYGEDISIPLKLGARTVAGMLPTGTVDLLDSGNTVLAQLTVDADAKVTFTVEDLLPGSYVYQVRYNGDANFNPLTVSLGTFTMSGWTTYTTVVLPKVLCSNVADVVVYVKTNSTTNDPTGEVHLSFGNQTIVLPLSPTPQDGVSKATAQVVLDPSNGYLYASYYPTGTFNSSYNYAYPPTIGGCVPLSLSATATAVNRVSLTWNPTGASSYEVLRSQGFGFSTVGYATTNAYLDTQVQSNHVYVYRVRPVGGALSEPDMATTFFFADDALVAGVTRVKALHFTELRTVVNLARDVSGLADWEPATTPVSNGVILGSHITELRDVIDETRRFLGCVPVSYTDPSLTGVPIKAVHVQQLRNALK
ncbi:MAG TPA: ELWxxDGT repeat protein [Thermoanaerobaculia bacterium]|nr:ELWxxDGT repeat protein [Thermoanaerobaculia bacterium]